MLGEVFDLLFRGHVGKEIRKIIGIVQESQYGELLIVRSTVSLNLVGYGGVEVARGSKSMSHLLSFRVYVHGVELQSLCTLIVIFLCFFFLYFY